MSVFRQGIEKIFMTNFFVGNRRNFSFPTSRVLLFPYY